MMNIGISRISAPSRTHIRRLLSLLLAALLALTACLVLPSASADDSSNRQTATANDQTAEVSGPRKVDVTGTIHVEGRDWKHSPSEGARIAVKYDKGTVAVNGESIVSQFEASADGTFSAELPVPTKANSDKPWLAGTEHTIHFLSGSLKDGDPSRNAVLRVTVAGQAESSEQAQPWVSATSSANSGSAATIDVAPFTTGEDAVFHLIGKGWKTADGKSGSIVSIKVNYRAPSGRIDQYARRDQVISDHLASLGKSKDSTSWVLLVPKGTATQDPEHGLYTIDQTGSFDITVKAPEELRHGKTGQYVTVTAQSGRNLDGDVQRLAVTGPIPVNGEAAQPIQETSDVRCTTQVTRPTARIENKDVARGGKLHLVGEGWCNPGGKTGAPQVAVKLDNGSFSHLDQTLHSNRSIWALVDPDPATGVLDAWIRLPDGTAATSVPEYPDGAHSLRLLSGALRAGDLSVSFGGRGSLDFTVGEYRPNGAAPALGLDELTEGSRHDVRVTREGTRITVEVPGRHPGKWVRATPYAEAAPRNQWGSGWVRLDDKRSLSYDLPDDAAAGDYRLVVQDGENEDFGKLLGWDRLTIPGKARGSHAEVAPAQGRGTQGTQQSSQSRAHAAPASGRDSGSEQTSASGAGPASPAAVRGMTSLGRIQEQTPRHARVRRVLRAPGVIAYPWGHAAHQPTQRVVASLRDAGNDTHHHARSHTRSQAPSSGRSRAQNSAHDSQGPNAEGEEAGFTLKVLTWNNVLLVLAGALLLAMILYLTHKPPQSASQASEASAAPEASDD
ncbi:hypothetical protein AB0Y14_04310 [Rothia sp. HC945]|uniref:hypothetical protein n=1 Tax=Rothia sp. HC945 TaxID=3171170 RepID=UPI003F1E8981